MFRITKVRNKFRLTNLEYFLALELCSELLFGNNAGKDKLINVKYPEHKEYRQ